jgi:hypothetical protein
MGIGNAGNDGLELLLGTIVVLRYKGMLEGPCG